MSEPVYARRCDMKPGTVFGLDIDHWWGGELCGWVDTLVVVDKHTEVSLYTGDRFAFGDVMSAREFEVLS